MIEGAVKLIYRTIYLHIKECIFYDLPTLNAAIPVALKVYNNALFAGRTYSRRDQFEEIEHMTLGKFNTINYELKKQALATIHTEKRAYPSR